MKNLYISLVILFFSGSLSAQWEVKNVNESIFSTLNVIKFHDSGLGFAMGTNGLGLMLKSEDFGETWQNIDSQIDGFISDFTFLTPSTVLCVSYSFDGQTFTRKISRSVDYGTSWTTHLSDEGDFNCIQSISSTSIIVSGSNRIYKSIDRGISWTIVYDLIDEGFLFGDIRRFDMLNDSVGYAVGGGVEVVNDDFPGFVLKTTNGGNDWEVISDFGSWLKEIDFHNEVIGYVSDGEYTYKTEDGGLTWETLSNIYGVVDFSIPSSNIIKTVHRPEAYIPEAMSTVFAFGESFDAGETWSGEYMNGAHLESIFFLNDSVGFVSGDYSIIMKTTNCGGEIIGDYPWHLFMTSTEEIELSDLEIYPNPTTDFISIKNEDLNGWDYTIYSSNSSIVRQGKLLSNRIEFNNTPPGLYFLVLKNETQRRIVKLVKK